MNTTVKDVLAKAAADGIVFSEKELDAIATAQRAERAGTSPGVYIRNRGSPSAMTAAVN